MYRIYSKSLAFEMYLVQSFLCPQLFWHLQNNMDLKPFLLFRSFDIHHYTCIFSKPILRLSLIRWGVRMHTVQSMSFQNEHSYQHSSTHLWNCHLVHTVISKPKSRVQINSNDFTPFHKTRVHINSLVVVHSVILSYQRSPENVITQKAINHLVKF